jgi:hypothetical protein
MSHHYSGPNIGFSRRDARLDLTDLYAFPKPKTPTTRRCGRQARESRSDLFPSPRGDGVAAFIEFDVIDEGLDRFTR